MRRTSYLASLFPCLLLALATPAAADDVTVTLDAGDGFVIEDNTGAIERLRIGLVGEVVPAEELMSRARRGTPDGFDIASLLGRGSETQLEGPISEGGRGFTVGEEPVRLVHDTTGASHFPVQY